MDENLKDWACSFSGCDGGNIDADIWLCGIEWGYKDATDEQRKDYYETGLLEEIKNGKVELNSTFDMFSDLTPQYHLKAQKLYVAITGKEKGKLLKLNLSPIAFREDDDNLWSDDIINATGYKTKESFVKDLNTTHRFKNIRNKHKPKIIIGTGVTHKANFAKSFFGDKRVDFTHSEIIAKSENNQRIRNFYYTKYDGTLLVVIPFLGGSNGLNSDYLIQEVSSKIKNLLLD